MMKFIWTKSTLPMSGVERWVLGEDCSHMMLVFTSYDSGLVFDIYYTGTRVRFLNSVMKDVTVLHEMVLPLSLDEENAVYDLIVKQFDGQSYAYGAMFYLGWRKVLWRLFKKPIPATNPWLTKNHMFCDMVGGVLGAIGLDVKSEMSAMMSPHDVWLALKDLPQLQPNAGSQH